MKHWSQIFKPPFQYAEDSGSYVLDSEGNIAVEIRGWGLISNLVLTGKITEEQAFEIQEVFAKDIANMLNRLNTAQECDATKAK